MHGFAASATLDALVAEVEAELSVHSEIERFVAGNSDGQILLNALYGDVLDEPIPERLLATLRENCAASKQG
jgi:hypothetical protein